MQKTWMVLALLVACGGATTPTNAQPAPQPVQEETPALRELRSAADAVCACGDGDCAQAAFEKLLTRQAELESARDRVGLDAAHDRAVTCYTQKTGVSSGASVVPLVRAAADEICACSDAPCVQAAIERLRLQLHERQDVVFTTGEQAAFDEAGQRLDQCAARVAGATHAM